MNKRKYVFEAEKMALSYKKLYLIEHCLKENIRECEFKSKLYFHELIPLIDKKVYPEEFRKKLYKLVKIRNKICHMKSLELEEENLLEYCYKKIILGFVNC